MGEFACSSLAFQLLAKVGVAGSNPVVRSTSEQLLYPLAQPSRTGYAAASCYTAFEGGPRGVRARLHDTPQRH